MTEPQQQRPRHRIAIIQEKDYLEDTYKTRTVIGLLPYEKEECERFMRFMPEQYSRPAPSPLKSGCDGCRKETDHLDCPTPGNCDQMKCPICCEGSDFPTLPEEIKKYEEAAAAQARKDTIYEMLKDFGYGCPGGKLTTICNLCTARKYCQELRTEAHKEQAP